MDELKTKIYRIGSAAGFSMSDNPDGADYDVNTMDSKGSWCYISHWIARMRNRMIYDDGSVVPVYHYDAYDWNDLIPLESFESRSMNTIIRDVFDNMVFRAISIECNASR